MLDTSCVVEQRVLDVIRYGCAVRMSEECGFNLHKFDVAYEVDHLTRNIVFAFNAFIAGEKLRTITYPTTWWDAVKERWFPEWALKKWPVNRTCFQIDALYPEMAIPDQGRIRVYRCIDPLKGLTDANR
jgi:hypothetical protein